MPTSVPHYDGTHYLTLAELESLCAGIAAALPDWVEHQTIGVSREGRPIGMITVGHRGDPGITSPSSDARADRPAFWLDGGTHAPEWTSVMSCAFTLSEWARALANGDRALCDWFRAHTAHIVPCISPDGFHALREGAPFLRSTLRGPRDARPRVGLDPCDVDDDGAVRWMRWKSPLGPWVFDADNPVRVRHRTLDDDPDDAWMLCTEGELVGWDGTRWTSAALKHGVDLNRNFPGSWAPFEMFGMDSGRFPLSEPESRAVVDAFAARPRIAAAVTNHTYTGCILTQPYRDPSPLGDGDVRVMERLATSAVEGTGYSVKRVVPDFTYDPKKSIVGVWADTMSTTFGVPGYTLELWNPYGHAGLELEDPAKFFKKPDLDLIGQMVDHFWREDPGTVTPWKPFEHPQLGSVEIGGLEYMQTIRNPPTSELPAECQRGFTVADRLRRALPQVRATLRVEAIGDGLKRVTVVFDNHGYLSTASLEHARRIGMAPPLTAILEQPATAVEGAIEQNLGWLDGWGAMQASDAAQPIYPGLPMEGGVRAHARWIVEDGHPVVIRWDAGRGGCGRVEA